MDCLEATTVTLFLDRRLPAERASRVEGHIDGCDECRRLLSELARGRAPAPKVLDPIAGDRVDRYVLLRAIGSGGMGTVYAAYDPVLDRKVAIKLLRTGTDDPGRRARLIREAQAMAKVASPNVVAVYDAGTLDDQVYISMELVAGGTLKRWLRERPRSWREIAAVFEAAGRGLAAAHANGIVHRDFKPDNVLIDGDHVRVADFGLAAPATAELAGEASSELERSLTVTGAVVGTPAYMSPEQIAGETVDARGDQFSFCVALYEALYGVRPFAGDTLAELSTEVRAGRVRAVPPRSSPSWLRAAVVRGLARDPASRHPSMAALLDRLALHRARPRWIWFAGAAVVAAAGIVIAAKLVTAGGAQEPPCRGFDARLAGVWDAQRKQSVATAFANTHAAYANAAIAETTRALDDYTAAWLGMRTEACEATRVRGDQSERVLDLRMQCLDRRLRDMSALVDRLATADAGVVARAADAAHALDPIAYCGDVDAVIARVPPPDSPVQQAAVDVLRSDLAAVRAAHLTGRYRDALALATPAVTRARAAGYGPVLAEALTALGEVQIRLQDWPHAIANLDEAARTAYAAGDDVVAAQAWSSVVYAAGAVPGDTKRAETALELARAAVQRVPHDDPLRVRLLVAEGALRYSQGKYADARDRHAEGLALADRVLAHDDDRRAVLRLNLAVDESQLGHYAAAVKLTREAAALRVATFGAEHPATIDTHGRLATQLEYQNLHDEALAEFDAAIAGLERSVGPSSPDLAMYLVNSCTPLQALGRVEEALARARRGLSIFEASVGADDPRTSLTLTVLARMTLAHGDAPAAIALYRRALAAQESKLGPAHPNLATTLNNLGDALHVHHEDSAALTFYNRALAITEKALGEKHLRNAYALLGIGQARAGMHDYAPALAALRRALALLGGPDADRDARGAVHLALADALAQGGGDRAEARSHAEQARADFEAAGDKTEAAAAGAWLASHAK